MESQKKPMTRHEFYLSLERGDIYGYGEHAFRAAYIFISYEPSRVREGCFTLKWRSILEKTREDVTTLNWEGMKESCENYRRL